MNSEQLVFALCSELKSIRISRKLKQHKVAKDLDLDPTVLSRIENNRVNNISVYMLNEIVNYYGMSLYDFVHRNEDITNSSFTKQDDDSLLNSRKINR